MERVLGITASYPSAREPWRMPQAKALFDGFAARGVETTVVVPRAVGDRVGAELEALAGVERPTYPSFSNQRIAPGLSTFRWTVASFRRAVRRAADRHRPPDVVYAYFAFPAGEAALDLARRRDARSVVALGESSIEYYLRHVGEERLRRVLGSVSGILCLCERRREYCRIELGLDDRRLAVIPNAADPDVFRPGDRARAREELGLAADRPIVITVGCFGARKGTHRVLRALRTMPDVGGVFLGNGVRKPIGSQVVHRGAESPRQVARWLRAADLFVLPTRAEGGAPNVVLEAMSVGLPIVVSDIPGMRSVVGDAGILLDDPDDVDGLAAAIRRVLDDPALARRMREASVERARAFTLEDRIDRILSWMETLEPMDHG